MRTFEPFGYTAQFLDGIVAGYPLGEGYRWYSPSAMRFTTADRWSPFGRGGINPYAYCEADPLNRRDPSGHMWMPEIDAMYSREDLEVQGFLDSNGALTTWSRSPSPAIEANRPTPAHEPIAMQRARSAEPAAAASGARSLTTPTALSPAVSVALSPDIFEQWEPPPPTYKQVLQEAIDLHEGITRKEIQRYWPTLSFPRGHDFVPQKKLISFVRVLQTRNVRARRLTDYPGTAKLSTDLGYSSRAIWNMRYNYNAGKNLRARGNFRELLWWLGEIDD
jgi:RHS repeat-associated protein